MAHSIAFEYENQMESAQLRSRFRIDSIQRSWCSAQLILSASPQLTVHSVANITIIVWLLLFFSVAIPIYVWNDRMKHM